MNNLKKTPLLILFMLTTAVFALSAADFGQKIYPVTGDTWNRIEILYLEQGIVPPSNSGPWSQEELLKMLHRIEPGDLSDAGKELYKLLSEDLGEQPKRSGDDGFGITAGVDVAVEAYYHTNENFTKDTDWAYGFEEREKLLSLPIEIWFGEHIYSYFEPFLGTVRYSEEDDIEGAYAIYSPTFTNNIVLLNMDYIDLTFPYRAFAAVGGDWWSLSAGRDILSWGAGHSGNMVLGSHHDYYEAIRFSAFFDRYKYTYVVAGFDHQDWTGGQNALPTGQQIFVGHRLENRLFDKVKLTIDEEAMLNLTSVDENGYVQAYGGFDLRFLNPMMIYHNTYNRGISNSILSVELEYTPWKYFSIYGQYAIDEYQSAEEKENHPNSNPGATGAIAGIEGVYPLGPGYLTSYFEFAKTDPYLYLRDDVDWIVKRRQFSVLTETIQGVKFLGYEEGPDAIIFQANAAYKVRDRWKAELKGTYMLHGDTTADTVWETGEESNSKTTPSGVVETTIWVQLYGEYNLPLFKEHCVSLYAEFDYINCENFHNVSGVNETDFQLAAGVKYSL